jgi:hypothetical protein
LRRTSPKGLLAYGTERKGEETDLAKSMAAFCTPRVNVVPKLGVSKHSNPLDIWVGGVGILDKRTSFGVIVTFKMDSTSTIRTKQPKTIYPIPAHVALVLTGVNEPTVAMLKLPWDEMVFV